MRKRIRKKLEKKNERLFGHIEVLSKYHCESCNMDFEMVGNKNIHIAKWFAPKCPICKNELKKLEL